MTNIGSKSETSLISPMSDDRQLPATVLSANSLFAFEPGAAQYNLFGKSVRLTLPASGDPVGIEVIAGQRAITETWFDAASGVAAYLWGAAGSLATPRAQRLQWIVENIQAGNAHALRDVVGSFIVLIDDRRHRRIRFASDILGIRPWFIGRVRDRLVCGSDVWTMREAGLIGRGINYDAVASWLRYLYDCTGQSLFSDLSAIGPGVVATYDGGTYVEEPYGAMVGGQERPSPDDLVDGIYHGVERSFRAATSDFTNVSIALSGGFDSRFLAALATRNTKLKVDAFSVADRPTELEAASRAARGLGLSLNVLHTDGSVWNVFDEPYHFTPGGFPITKQLSHIVATQRPGISCLNGFLGDPMVRGTLDRAQHKLECQTPGDLASAYQVGQVGSHTTCRFDLLDSDLLNRCDRRMADIWRRQARTWEASAHLFFALGIFVRQRHYMSNNFRQHLDVAEALTPFASWDVLQFKFRNAAECYGFEVYESLFKRFFPEIADVPHNTRLGVGTKVVGARSRATRQWASAVLQGLTRRDCLPMVSRRKAIPRLLAAWAGKSDVAVVPLFLYRMLLLEQRMHASGLDFDWREI